jgi:hypothetical protein
LEADLEAGLEADLERADEEREVILFEPIVCVST